MMMKGSSSTFLCALVGLSVLLCGVNEAQGWACYRHLGEGFKEVRVEDCSTDLLKIECKGDTPYQGCQKKTRVTFKDCACSSSSKDTCEDGECFCRADFCNDDKLGEEKGGKGGAASPVLAFSTLFSASAMVIITSSFWTLF